MDAFVPWRRSQLPTHLQITYLVTTLPALYIYAYAETLEVEAHNGGRAMLLKELTGSFRI